MKQLFVVVQTVIKGAGMEMETLLRRVQVSKTREGCRKSQKNPREAATKHKNG